MGNYSVAKLTCLRSKMVKRMRQQKLSHIEASESGFQSCLGRRTAKCSLTRDAVGQDRV